MSGSIAAIVELVERDAAEWGVSAGSARRLFLLPVVVAGVIALTVPIRPLYRALVFEDGIIEWVQAGLVAGLVVLGIVIARRLASAGHRWPAALYLMAAGAAIVVFGEEISWGQRIFGLITPDELGAINRQGETNLHNIGDTLKILNLIMLVVALVAAMLPLGWRRWAGDRRRTMVEMLFVPPLFTVPAFLLVVAYRLVRIVVLPEAPAVISRYQEVIELAFYFGLFAFAYLVARRLPREIEAEEAAAA